MEFEFDIDLCLWNGGEVSSGGVGGGKAVFLALEKTRFFLDFLANFYIFARIAVFFVMH